MNRHRYPPYSRIQRKGSQQSNHIFVIAGRDAFYEADKLYRRGQCQPAIPVQDNLTPSLYKWPVFGMGVTVRNLGTSVEFAESLVYELLKAGANLVVHVDADSGYVSIHRPGDPSNAA